MASTGLYLHVPFCSALCPYCDFAVVVGRAPQHDAYLRALEREARAEAWPVEEATVFIGGGTPSFVDGTALARTATAALDASGSPNVVEFTVEANPESTTDAFLRALLGAGLDRVSIGAQSFDDDVLRALGRTHDATAIARAVTIARDAGIGNVSLDLIYGTPAETHESWERSLRAALALEPDHLSCYALTIEERTAFGKAVAAHAMRAPDDDVLARRFDVACDILDAAGFVHYEISNWARPGRESRHNIVYWSQGDYLGLGLGAHSHRAGERWSNDRSLTRYLADPTSNERIHLTNEQRAEEWLSLRIRLLEPIMIADAEQRLGRALHTGLLEDAGLIERDARTIRLTRRGMMLENEVTARLLTEGAETARNQSGTGPV